MYAVFCTILAFLLIYAFPGSGLANDPVNLMVVYGQSETAVKAYIAAEDIKGATIAVERINSEGGLLGRKINIIDMRAVNNLQIKSEIPKILKEKKILAVVGANTSNITMTIAPILQDAQIPVISPIATNPKVTLIGDFIFRACFTDPFQGRVMARFALNDLKARTSAILVKVNSKFSTSLTKYFKEAFEPEGEIVYEGQYMAEDVDFSELLFKVKELNPDVVFVPGHGRDSGMIIRQAHAMGIKTKFLGGDGWGKGVLGVAGPEAVDGHYFTNHWHMNVQKPLSRRFVQDYTAKYGEKMIAASAPLAHDAVMLLANAVNKAQSFAGVKIRDVLLSTNNFQGITGKYGFDENGDPINKEAVILKYENGDIMFVKSITP